MKKIKGYIPIIAIAIVIIVALIIVFIPKNDKNTVDGIKIVQIEKEEALDTTKKQAVDATIEQFKRLGENVQESDLKIDIIERNGESFYLIKSPQNSIQIQINTGKIVRINSVSI
jgi:hypothetical protein